MLVRAEELFKACMALPYPLRLAFSVVMFSEAGALAYGLAVLFPLELHLYFLTVATMTLVLKDVFLVRGPSSFDLEETLQQALEWLKQHTGIGWELRVKWIPDSTSNLSGEVRDDVIYIYDENVDEALETLVEEFLEYILAYASEPYRDALNAVIKAINAEAYLRRDKAAKALSKLIAPMLGRLHQRKPDRQREGVADLK